MILSDSKLDWHDISLLTNSLVWYVIKFASELNNSLNTVAHIIQSWFCKTWVKALTNWLCRHSYSLTNDLQCGPWLDSRREYIYGKNLKRSNLIKKIVPQRMINTKIQYVPKQDIYSPKLGDQKFMIRLKWFMDRIGYGDTLSIKRKLEIKRIKNPSTKWSQPQIKSGKISPRVCHFPNLGYLLIDRMQKLKFKISVKFRLQSF